jgi:uncharacterized membrane protein
MVRRQAVLRDRKSIAGAALIGLGLFILFWNPAEAIALIRFLGTLGEQADSLGQVTSMAVQHFLQGYVFDHTECLQVLYQVLLSFSGVLLIVMGTIFLAAVFAGREGLKKRKRACRFRCLSFDV